MSVRRATPRPGTHLEESVPCAHSRRCSNMHSWLALLTPHRLFTVTVAAPGGEANEGARSVRSVAQDAEERVVDLQCADRCVVSNGGVDAAYVCTRGQRPP